MQHDGKILCELGDRRRLGIERILATRLDWWRRANLPRTTGTETNKIFLFFCLILVEREQKADDEQSVMSVEHGSRKQWQKAAKSVTAQKQVSQSKLERYTQRYSLESQRNFSRIQVQSGRYHMFKVAEHSFGSLWVYVICQIMARERLQLTSWNLASEKYTDERFWLTGKIWRFRSFHGNMND